MKQKIQTVHHFISMGSIVGDGPTEILCKTVLYRFRSFCTCTSILHKKFQKQRSMARWQISIKDIGDDVMVRPCCAICTLAKPSHPPLQFFSDPGLHVKAFSHLKTSSGTHTRCYKSPKLVVQHETENADCASFHFHGESCQR